MSSFIPHLRQQAFSLVELAMVLAMAGLMLGFALQANESATTNPECYTTTKTQLLTIRAAIENFARKNDRLPMPAKRALGVEDINYGRETIAANLTVTGASTWGTLPFQALGLSPSFAADCWGNKFTYVVTTALTTNAASGGYLDASVGGALTLISAIGTTLNTTTAYAVISHGEDALGAVKANATAAAWCSTGAPMPLKYTNCNAASATVADAVFNNGKNAGTNYYDDLITYTKRAASASTNLYCWGSDPNGLGLLANGVTGTPTTSVTRPTVAQGTLQFTSIISGDGVACALTSDGTAYCWGDNTYGQVGDGTSGNFRGVPTAVNTAQKFASLWTAGSRTMCGLNASGTAYCWGRNSYGQIGDNSTTMRTSPVTQTAPAAAYTKIVGDRDTACGLATDAQVYCWGNSTSQIGRGLYPANPGIPTAIATRRAAKLERAGDGQYCLITSAADPAGAGKLYCWGWFSETNDILLPVASYNITGITQASSAQVTTSAAHGLVAGDRVYIDEVQGMIQINNPWSPGGYNSYTVLSTPTATKFTINLNTTVGYSAYSTGGRLKIIVAATPRQVDVPSTVIDFFGNTIKTSDNQTWRRGENVTAANGSGGVQHTAWDRQLDSANHEISSITNANPAVVTTVGAHGYADGARVLITHSSMSLVDSYGAFIVRNPTATTFELYYGNAGSTYNTPVNTTADASYGSGAYATPFPGIDNYVAISSSGQDALAVTTMTWQTPSGGPYNFSQLYNLNPISMGITAGNQLYVWGINWMYSCGGGWCGLGDGVATSRSSPVLASLPGGVTPMTLVPGDGAPCFISTTNYLYCWGSEASNWGLPVWGDSDGRKSPTAAATPAGAPGPVKFSAVATIFDPSMWVSPARCGITTP